ncbi:unnamed protein product [Closterium sp. Naga37s-1]|nr:unnamed protein product [Closterium sp. Naga37s-1]
MASNSAAIAGFSASGGATRSPRPSRSAPAPFLTSSVVPHRYTITTGLNRSSFPFWHGLRAPSLRRPDTPYPSLLRTSSSETRRNDSNYGSSSRLPLLAAASVGDAGGDGDCGNRGGTGESEGATGELESVGELEENGMMGKGEEHPGEQTEEQAAAAVPPVASDQPNQRLTAHLDLNEVRRQLQRSNERTAENLKHLKNRLHASNEWTARHLKKSKQQTRENLKHLKTHLETHLHASNEWTLSHLKKGHQWTSEHLRESNQRTREQLQHLIHSEQLLHLEGHLDVRALKARLHASNAKTMAQLRHLGVNLEHLEGHLDVGALKARLDASNSRTKAQLKRRGRQASHTVHGVADVLSVIGAAAAAATAGAAGSTGGAGGATAGATEATSTSASGSAAPPPLAGSTGAGTGKERAAGGADGGDVSKTEGSASSSAATRSLARNPYLSGNFRPVGTEVLQELDCAVSAVHLPSTIYLPPLSLVVLLATALSPFASAFSLHHSVIGQIPQGLRGRFIRNGPNPQLPPSSPELYHWFDGDGMLHSVNFHPPGENFHSHPREAREENFHSPQVSYRRRYIRTTGWQEERAAGRALFGGLQQVGLGASHLLLAAMNLLGLRQQDAPMWNMTKNVSNNHFIQHAGRLLSLWEAGLPYSLDPSTLDTKGVHSFDDTWRSGMTAHPKVDPITNHMMIYGYNLTHKPYLRYGVVDPSGSLIHATDLDLPHPVMMHDFAITEHHSIFLDFPLRFQLDKVIQSHGKAKPFVFDPSKPSRIGVLPRFGSNPDIRWFTVKPGFCLHVVNAFEEPSSAPSPSSSSSSPSSTTPDSPPPTIILRVIRFPAFSALGLAELADELACDEVAQLHEYRLDLQSGAVEERSLCKVCCDFPSINPNFTGRPHRFAYSARFTAQPGPGTTVPSFNAIMKHDFQLGTYQVHTLPPGRFCGEPVFAPRHHFQSSSRSQSGEARSDEVGMGRDVVGLGADAVGMGAEEEDDGWVLAHVWDEEEMRSEVIVLDAMNLDKQPLARIILPKRVPYGFHGTFLPD